MSDSLFISAGEFSGDQHGAEVADLIKKANPSMELFGLGGDALREAGVTLVEHNNRLAFMGLGEVVRNYSFLKKVMKRVLAEVDRQKPAAALLIDYPGFNMRLARALKKRGVQVYYYISPKFWAWNHRRLHALRAYVDHMLVIFPFEVALLRENNIAAMYVGNPLVEQVERVKTATREFVPWGKGKRVALLPGSRKQEVERILPVMVEAAIRLKQKIECSFVIAVPNPYIAGVIREMKLPISIKMIIGYTPSAVEQSDAAWVASGTATLEAALLNTPHVLVYRTGVLTYLMAKAVLDISHVGLVNILADREVCPELLQGNAHPDALVERLLPLLEEGAPRQEMVEGFASIRKMLGTQSCAGAVAQQVNKAYSAG
jgi:lipid-A-disaccharide synthase